MKFLRSHKRTVSIINLAALFGWTLRTPGADFFKTSATVDLNLAGSYAENLAPSAADILVFSNQITTNSTFNVLSAAGTFTTDGLRLLNDMGGTVTIRTGNNFANTIALGAGGIDMQAANQNLTFNGTTGSGQLTVNMTAAQQWLVRGGRTLRVDSILSGTGTGLTIGPSSFNGLGGTVDLRGANTFTGLTSVTGSALVLDYGTAANRIDSGSGLTLNRSTLTVQGGATFSQVVNGLNLGAGANQLTFAGTTASVNVGAITRSGFDSLLNVGTTGRATTSTPNTNSILGGWAVLNKTDWAVGGGSITALAAASYTAKPAGAYGAAAGVGANVRIDGTVTAVPDETINSLKFASGAFNLTQNSGTTLNLVSGGVLKNDNNATVISGGSITAGGVADGNADTLYVWQNNNTMTISSLINNNGADVVNLVKAGDGTLRFENATNHGMTGTMTITGGRVVIGNAGTTGNLPGSNVVLSISPGSAAGTAANDGMLVYNRTDAATWTQNLTGVGGDDASRFALRKSAGTAAALTLTPGTANTYSGGTSIEAGTIAAGGTTALSPNSVFQLSNVAGVTLDLAGFDNTIRGLTGGGITGGNVNLGAATLTVAPTLIDNPTFAGVISGTGGLIKNGAASQTLSAVQAYNGATTVNAGVLTVGGLATGSGPVTVNNIGTVLGINSNSSVTTFASSIDSSLVLGTTAASAGLTVADGGTTISGVIRETTSAFPGSLTKQGAAMLILAGGNSYTGGTTVSEGTLQLDNTVGSLQKISDLSAVTVDASGALDLNSVNETVGSLAGAGTVTAGTGRLTTGGNGTSTTFGGTITGTGGLTKVGAGTFTLTNNHPSLTGAVEVRSGGLTLAAGAANTLNSTVPVSLTGRGASLNVNTNQNLARFKGGDGTFLNIGLGATLTTGSGIGTTFTVPGASLTAGSSLVPFSAAHGLTEGMLLTGTGYAPGTFVRRVISPTLIEVSAPPVTTETPGTNVFPTGIIASSITGQGGLTKEGTGTTLWLTGQSSYTGATTVNAGTLLLGSERAMNQTLSKSSVLVVNTGGTVSFFGPNAQVRQYQEVGSLSGSGGTIDLFNGGISSGVLVVGSDNSTTSWAGILAGNNGETGFMKTGTGALTLTGAHTYDGVFRVDQGTVNVSSTGRLDDSSFIILGNQTGATVNYSIALNQTDAVSYIGGGGRAVGFAPYTLGSGVASQSNLGGNFIGQTGGEINIATTNTLQQSGTTGPRVFGGILTGLGTFRKSGTGLLELWGANTVSNVTVDAGTLKLGAFGTSTGLGPLSTAGIGSFGSTTTLAVTNAATLVDLNGANQTLNALTSSGGVALGNGSLTIATLSGASGNYAGAITGTGGVTVNATLGANGWDLTGGNTFTGPLVINSGLVRFNRAATGGAIGDATPVTVATGAFVNVLNNDTIGSLSGGGTVTVTSGMTLRVSQGNGGVFSGTLAGTGTAAFTLAGGAMTLRGNNSIAGTFSVIGGGALNLDYSSGATNLIPGALTLAQSRIFLKGNSTAETLTGVTLNAGGQSFEALVGDTSRINLGTITRNGGSSAVFWGNSASTSTANTASGILGGYAVYGTTTVQEIPDTWAVSNGAGTAISGLAAGSYAANAFGAGFHTNITTTGPHSFGSGSTETIRFNSAVAATVNINSGGPTVINSGGILVTPNVRNNLVTINGSTGSDTLSGGSGAPVSNELIIHQHNPSNRLLLNVEIADNAGTTRLTKAGQGLVVLGRDSTYSGSTTITAGDLQVGNGGISGSLSTGSLINNGILTVNRSDAYSLAMFISGSGSIRQLGTGTTTISGNSTFTGTTSVIGGTLAVSGSNALGSIAGITSLESGRTIELTGVEFISGEIIALKGATLLDTTDAFGQGELSGLIGLLGMNNTISTGTLNDELRIRGTILGMQDTSSAVGQQPANLVIGGLGKTTLEGNNWYLGTTTINSGATLALGRNNAGGNLGVGNVTNNGTLFLDRSDVFYLPNSISGTGGVTVNRSTAYLAGNQAGLTGDLIVLGDNANVQVFLGDHDFVGGVFGFSNINVSGFNATTNNGGNNGVRFNQSDNFLASGADISLLPFNNPTFNNNRQTYFVKNGLSTLELTGQIAGEQYLDTGGSALDDRSLLEVNSGLLRIVTNQATQKGLMGFTSGVADPSVAFGGQINLNGDANQGRVLSNWGYFEITGDADQDILANFTGGGNADQGGIAIFNTSGTTTISSLDNTLFNSRNQINKGTVVFAGSASTPNAWRNDGAISVGAGATLRIEADEITNIGLMKNGTLALNASYTNNGDFGFFAAGQITGTGNLTLNGNVTNRLYNTNNTFGGGLNLNRGVAQFVTAGSLGTSTITLDSAGLNEAENQLLQYVGLGTSTVTVNNAINLTGTVAGRLKGISSSGTGQLVIAGTVTVDATNTLILRGNSTGISSTTAPFATWAAGIPTVSGQITGAGALTKDDAGAWSVTNLTNDFTGNVNLNNGRFSIPALAVLGNATKTINLGSGTGTPQWEFDSTFAGGILAATTDMNLSGTTGAVRIVNLGTGAVTIADPTWTATGAGAKTLTLGRLDDVAGYVNVIEGAIVNSSSATALTKDGRSTWRLNGVNTYTGTTTVNEGILQLGNAAGTTLAANAAVTVVNAFGRGATLELLSNESMGALTVGIGATVNLNGNTLTVGENNVAMTNNGVITGTGSLIKIGTQIMTNGAASSQPGLLQLGQNTYTGLTTISGGRIDTSTFANGGAASGFGASTSVASNLRINGANNVIDIGIRYIGTGPASTDRLFQISPSDSATRTNNGIWASPAHVVGVNDDSIVNFTNTGAIGFTAASGAATLTLRGNEAGALRDHTFSPQIIDNPGGGATSLNKVEAGTWLVTNAANNYTGTTTISGGTLVITASGALGATTGGTNVTAGAAGLELRGGITVTGETVTNTGDGGFLGSGAGINTWSGAVQMNQNTRLYAKVGTSLEVTGVVASDTNGRNLNKYDAGTVILTGNNTYAGPTQVQGGTLRLNYATNNTSKLSDSTALTLGGSGLVTLGGADDNNLGASYQVAGSGGTLELAGGSHTEIVSASTVNAGSSRIIQSGGTAILRMNAITRNIGGVLDFGAGSIANTDTLVLNAAANSVIGGWATINRTDWAISANTGTDVNITALAPAGYSPNTLGVNLNTDVTSSFTGVGTTTGTIRLNSAGNSTVTLAAGANLIASGGILVTPNASGNNTITGGTSLGARFTELVINHHGSGTLTIDSVVGPTTTLFTGAPTGDTANNSATISNLASTAGLQIGSVVSGPGITADSRVVSLTATSVTLNRNATATATGVSLTINNAISTVTGTRTNASNQITALASTANLQVGMALAGAGIPAGAVITRINDGTSVTISANATASGATSLGFNSPVQYLNGGLTKTGSGTAVLTQDNTYTGPVNIQGGTLQVGNGGTTGTLGVSGGLNNPITFGEGASLVFNSTKTTEYDLFTLSGDGNLILAATNTQTILLDDDNNNFIGDIVINGGILAARGNNNALGNVRDAVIVNSGGTLQSSGATQTFANFITLNDGAVLSSVARASVTAGIGDTVDTPTFSGRIFLNNTTPAGVTYNVTSGQTPTVSATVSGSNGFTKTGNGTLILSGQNIFDGTPILNGQVIVAGGVLSLGRGDSLGGVGVGNETVVQSGASLDLRGNGLNLGDNNWTTREIVRISGTGFLGTGALRNTTGTGTVSTLELAANASIGGTATLDLGGFDTDVGPGVTITRPVINGGGNSLTKVGVNDARFLETDITSLNKLIISEGEVRSETRAQFPFVVNAFTTDPLGPLDAGTPTPLASYPHTLLTAASIPGGIDIVYGGQTTDPVNTLLQNAIVGSRLELFRQHGAHHTANITSFGAASGTGGSYLELNSDTLPKTYTFWDGSINLTGLANGSNTFINVEGGGAGLSVGDGVLGTQSPSGDQVANPNSILIVQGAFTGTGGVTKIGSRELRLTANNTFTGDFVVTRQTNIAQPIDPVQNEAYANMWSASLYGQGTLAGTSNIVLERRGALRVINHADFNGTNVNGAGTTNLGTNLTNRINDTATIKLHDGFLVFDNGSTAVTETLGTVRPEFGDSFIAVNPKDGSNVNTTITIDKIERQAGSTLTLSSWDSTSTFGIGTPAGDDSVRFKLNSTTGLTLTGAATGVTDKKIAVGLYAGLAPLANDDPYLWANGTASTHERNNLFFSGRDFVTLDSGYLRPLDNSEYYTNTASMAGAAGQNLNLSLPSTAVLTNLSINSLRFGNLNDNLNNNVLGSTLPDSRMLGWQQTTNALTLDDGVTLTIDSGMILFANMGQGINQDMQSYINGGTINFGNKEGIISNINGWYRTTDGSYQGSAAFIRSSIAGSVAPGSVGITKTGFQEVYFDGINTYTGLTKVANGPLRVRNSSGLGAGGDGNGLVIEGSGSIMYNTGINIGQNIAGQVNPSLAANGLNINAKREDIFVGQISADNQVFLRSNDSVNRHYGNITIDNVDSVGQTAQGAFRAQPRLLTDANATIILAGTIGGGNTAVSQDTYYIDARGFSLDGSSGNFILQGSVGDKLDAGGNAVAVSGPVSNKPTGTVFSATSTTATTASLTVPVANLLGLYVNMPISGPGIPAGTTVVGINAANNTLTLSQAATIPTGSTLSSPAFVNENEVLRMWIGGSDQLNVEAQQQWKAVGRVELQRGFLRYTGAGDFYDAGTLALINGSEAGNNQIGFQIGGGVMKNDPGNDSMANLLLTQAGQSFGVNNWTITTNANNNQGAVMIGGENESGTVRYGPSSVATPSTITLGRGVAIHAEAGGTVDVFSRFTGGSISKVGRGTVNLFGNAAGAGSASNLLTAGGELNFIYTFDNSLRMATNSGVNFNGGALRVIGNTVADTTQGLANSNGNAINIRPGSTEISVQSSAGRTTSLNIGLGTDATTGSVLTRTVGGTLNLVEAGNGGTAAITFTSRSSIATRNQLIPWATYGTAVGTASDFAMIDTNANGIDGFRRATDENVNDVTAWVAGMDVSENGGSGYRGTLAASLALNSLHLDAAADSVITIAGGQTLSVASGGLMLATGVGASNKTITGGIFSPVGVYGVATTNSTTSVTVASTASLAVGMPVSGTGIPAGATITAINVNGTDFTLSAAATATGTANLAIGELIVHHYGAGNLNLASQLGTQNGAPAVVTISGPTVTGAAKVSNWNPSTTGQVVVSADNSNAGAISSETKWNLNGSVLSINNENQLGKVDITAATADAIYFNGGALRWTGNQYTGLDNERGITIGGGGAVIDVVDGGANLQLTGDIVSENWLNHVQTGAANQYVGGDLIKMGAGTLTLTGGTDANQIGFTGGIDVREGTLRINGNNASTTGTQTVSILGDNRSALDGTVFRNGTNFEVAFGPTAFLTGTAPEWRTEEWLRFEGNNTIRIGTPGGANRTTHLNGVIDLAGDVTVYVVPGLTARFNQSSGGYMTGTGDVTKVGQGILELRDNNVLWSGGLNVLEGTLRLGSTGLPGGVGTQAVTLGSASHQGIADLQMFSENQIVGSVYELYQDINVTYNPLQTKRISFGADQAAGNDAWFHGDVTLSDNVGIYLLQGGRFHGGAYNNMYFTGDFKDDIANSRSGNIVVHVDDTNNAAANNQQAGEGVGYVVLRGNNSAWTGDLTIGLNQSWDQDEISVVRLENVQALTAVNDVTMNGSSRMQLAGNNVTIGNLITNNAAANGAQSTANDGLGNFQGTTGSSAWIENAGTAPARITITQTTPVNTEALWDVHFRDGQLPSHVLDNPQLNGGSLSVVKAGNGWATMSVDNEYTGTTRIASGILQVGKNGVGDTGAARLATAPGLTADAGAILAGSGVVQGATVISSGASLKPGDVGGNGIGTLTLNGNAALAIGSTTSMQVKGASYNNTNYLGYRDLLYGAWIASIPTDTYSTALNDPLLSTQHDRVNVQGALTWSVGSTINIVNDGYTPTVGDIFNLFDWFTVAGGINVGPGIRTGTETGTNLNLFDLGGDFRWDTTLFNSHGILVVVSPGLIPEPSRLLLLMLGLLGVFFRRRRASSLS